MKRAGYAALALVLWFGVRGPLSAHHSFAAHYDTSKPITVQGTLVQVRMTNPQLLVLPRGEGGQRQHDPLVL